MFVWRRLLQSGEEWRWRFQSYAAWTVGPAKNGD